MDFDNDPRANPEAGETLKYVVYKSVPKHQRCIVIYCNIWQAGGSMKREESDLH